MRHRTRADRGQRQRDRLFRHLPDRKERAENDGKINRALKDAAFFVFGTDEQRVGRFESFGGVYFVFHRVGWLTTSSYCIAHATPLRRVISNCGAVFCMIRPGLVIFAFGLAPGIIGSEFGTPKPVQNRGAEESTSAPPLNEIAGLHVVQRAATPAREPAPVGVDIISSSIIPAGVEQMPAATARFTPIAFFFRPTAALFIRLLT